MKLALPFVLVACGCAASEPVPTPAPAPDAFVLRGGVLADAGAVDVVVRDGLIAGVTPAGEATTLDLAVVDVTGRFLTPAVVDAHVHLAYWDVADELLDHGVAAAVDLASPIGFLDALPAAPLVVAAGPMLTAPGGYPTQGWGRGGYGREVTSPDDARAAVADLHGRGARLLKLPFGHGPVLDDETMRAAVVAAHERGMLVAAHALADAEAARAAAVGCDLLAHTPVEPLTDATVSAWAGGTVVSTLAAFGGSRSAVDNLRRLRAAGARVVYGTDLGNRREARVDAVELALLREAGLSPADILRAATVEPARLFGLDALGAIEPGRAASLLVTRADPLRELAVLGEPDAVLIDGAWRGR